MLWRNALRQSLVWKRAARLGLGAGVIQAIVNQGDHWIHHAVTPAIMAKTLMSPLIGFTLVFISSAGTWVDGQIKTIETPQYDEPKKI